MKRILGADVSLNHSGFVLLDEYSTVLDYAFITEKAGDANRNREHGVRWKQPVKRKDNDMKRVVRLAWLDQGLRNVYERMKPDLIVLEGYAFDTHGAHQMGEVGGLARLLAYQRGCPQRWHDPLTLKMFACHKGNAKKGEVQDAVERRWGADFKHCGAQAHEDLCDAYVLAKMGLTEVQLRDGQLMMSDLHPKEIQVFNRTTKAAPINVLGREWISPMEVHS